MLEITLSGAAMVVAFVTALCTYKQANAVQEQVKILQAQTKLLQTDFNTKNQKEEFSSAFAITKYYMDEILPQIDAVRLIVGKTGLNCEEMLKKCKDHDLDFFDIQEFRKIYSPEDHKTISKIFCEPIYIDEKTSLQALALIKKSSFFELKKQIKDSLQIIINCGEKSEVAEENIKEDLAAQLNMCMTITANKIEYFSMFFNTKLAEDDVIFDSIHQTFLSAVQLLYYNAALRNNGTSQKYYTHTLKLYKKWRERFLLNQQKNAEIQRRLRSPQEIKEIKK